MSKTYNKKAPDFSILLLLNLYTSTYFVSKKNLTYYNFGLQPRTCKVLLDHCTKLFEHVQWKVRMTSFLMHTVAHSTRHSSRPKTNNQPLKKFLSLAVK